MDYNDGVARLEPGEVAAILTGVVMDVREVVLAGAPEYQRHARSDENAVIGFVVAYATEFCAGSFRQKMEFL